MSTTLPEVGHAEIPKFWPGDTEGLTAEYLDGKLGEVVDSINVRWGSVVADRLRSGKLPERLFKAVVVRVASRVFSNTDGYKSETEGGYSYEVNAAVASGTIWFTDDDIADLTGKKPKGQNEGTVGTITVGRHRPAGRGW